MMVKSDLSDQVNDDNKIRCCQGKYFIKRNIYKYETFLLN